MTSKEAFRHIIDDDFNMVITTLPSQLAYNGITKKDMIEIIEKDLKKLGQLEDVEDELGVVLTTLFKALKNGIYIKNRCGEIEYYKCRGIALEGMIVIDNTCDYSDCDFSVYFNEYGKTWALTKEVLENEKLV